MNKFILFIDSGIGGISILKSFLEKQNNSSILYFADTENFPYGNREQTEIAEILVDIYRRMSSKYDIGLITVACNTASVSALDQIRKVVKIPVVGTVPAIKKASESTKNNKIGVIATNSTVKQRYIYDLIDKFARDKEVFIHPCPELVNAVELDYNKQQIIESINKELSFFNDKDIDSLVLGCTHYSFLIKEINEYFIGKVRIIDSSEGVSNRIISLIDSSFLSYTNEKYCIISSNITNCLSKYERLNNRLNIFDKILLEEKICLKA